MKNKILEKLVQLEQEKGIDILFAVESGSRAWGFPSPDSDYDIRFVYKHPKDWYLNLWQQKDTLEFVTSSDLDGSGWDLRKALQLLAKSNISFTDWVFSPIVYRANEAFLKDLKKLAANNFNPVPGFYHFDAMYKGFEEKLAIDKPNLKSFFYALRAALCANWIVKKQTIPPVYFKELYVLIDKYYHSLVDELILLKNKQMERSTVQIHKDLIHLMNSIVEENLILKENIQSKKAKYEEFNALFLKYI